MSRQGEEILGRRRELAELADDTAGQLAVEWLLVTALIVMPIVLWIPYLVGIIRTYFYRIAEVVGLPFP